MSLPLQGKTGEFVREQWTADRCYFGIESPEVMLPFRNTINADNLRKYSSVLVGPGMKDILDINTYLKEAFNAGVKACT
ncbi:MAG: hypothetical protein U0T81_10380 [Saprospiraceae bacterium]